MLAGLAGKGRVRSVAAGEYHAVVAIESGDVLTWGTGAGSPVPAPVQGLPSHKALAVAAGYQHSLAVMACDSPGGVEKDTL